MTGSDPVPVPDPVPRDVPLSHLPPAVKARLGGSFGGVASHYQRFRPGPPEVAVAWLLPERVGRVVDLGAGTGALTRLLVGRADDVVAVEPDARMRSVLRQEVPASSVVEGRGEAMPVPDGSADAVLASSSWHWMDPLPTLAEVARVLVPGGTLGAVWSGPDPEGPFLVQARALLAERSVGGGSREPGDGAADEFAGLIMGDGSRPASSLEIPPGVPFDQPDHRVFRWDVALNTDDLIGLLGTFSWVITMPAEARARVTDEARRLLREVLGVEGEVTIDVAFRADTWRSRRHG